MQAEAKHAWNMPDAFAPMFSDTIGYEGVRANGRFRDSFSACVFVFQDQTVADFSTDTDSRKLVAQIPIYGDRGWNREDKPQIGDKITLADGSAFAVEKADYMDSDYYTIEAREC